MKRSRKPKAPPKQEKTRWEKSADRENERRRRKAPLFVHAGIVPLATPEEREARFGSAFRERLEREDQERKEAEVARAAELRGLVAQRVAAERLAEFDAKASRSGSPSGFWGSVLRALEEQESFAPRKMAVSRRRAPQSTQIPLFVVAEKTETLVPLVENGQMRTPEAMAADGCETDPEKAKPDRVQPHERGPCPDCGWVSRGAFAGVLDEVHPFGCPSLRAFLLGLSERCEACRKRADRRDGSAACEAHRARCVTCARDGCIPGPPPAAISYLAGCGEFCQRCGCSIAVIGKLPYLCPTAA